MKETYKRRRSLPEKSSKKHENLVLDVGQLINLRVTYKGAPLPVLEALTLKMPKDVIRKLIDDRLVCECLLLQTCNRVEFYAVADSLEPSSSAKVLAEYWLRWTNFEAGNRYLETSSGSDVIRHVMRLASGLESMVVGEDQILGQIQEALDEAVNCGAASHMLRFIFERAVKTGRTVRAQTRINKGSVSIGSVAVNLLEEAMGELKHKEIMLIGAGQIAEPVAKALAARNPAVVFVANRTYDRAVSLARMLGAQAVGFDRIEGVLASVDAVVVATSAPHYVLTREQVTDATRDRKSRLLIVDISQPRNVDEGVADLENVELRNIDNLRELAQSNLLMRLKEAEKAEAIVEDEVERVLCMLRREHVEPIVSAVYSRMEEIRSKEVAKALRIMSGSLDDKAISETCRHCRRVVDDLSQVLVRKLLADPITKVRTEAANGDTQWATTIRRLFDLEPFDRGEH
ncbi:MAG: glutamyl-tRNA reductase [Candidatus Bathyarchaeia archaeon]